MNTGVAACLCLSHDITTASRFFLQQMRRLSTTKMSTCSSWRGTSWTSCVSEMFHPWGQQTACFSTEELSGAPCLWKSTPLSDYVNFCTRACGVVQHRVPVFRIWEEKMLQTGNYSLVLLIQLSLLAYDLFVNSFSELLRVEPVIQLVLFM